jgi:hypothetical protein
MFDDLDVKLKLFTYDNYIKQYSIYDVRGSKSDLATAVYRLYDWSCTWQLQIANKKMFCYYYLYPKPGLRSSCLWY